ncbi:hypothetical protein, partial [Campylobacter molothri]|uniref:hypothetical protein n=1 Tax=Campylobacter molothri TaxID=1032242 RepID=UPI0035B19463
MHTKPYIIIMGASNSCLPGGLRAGLSQDHVIYDNLSIGGSIASSKIYTILKHKEKIKKADLIILECNLADVDRVIYEDINLNECIRNTCWLYEELYKLNKKVLNLLLVNSKKNQVEVYIRNIHKYLCNKYGFNSIDMHDYYESKEILDFYISHPDPVHQIHTIMYNLGKNIVDHLEYFKIPKKNIKLTNPKFYFLTPLELHPNKKLKYILRKHIIFQECEVYRVEKDIQLKFPNYFYNCILIGIHTYIEDLTIRNWMRKRQNYGSLVISNKNKTIVKSAACFNTFLDIKEEFIIDEFSRIRFNNENLPISENSFMVVFKDNRSNTLDYVDISAFLLADQNGKFDFSEEIAFIKNNDIFVDEEYDFSYLVPPVEDYKSAIEEYNFRMDPIKQAPLQNQINTLKTQISNLIQEKQNLQNNFQAQLNSFPIKKQHLELANLEQDL